MKKTLDTIAKRAATEDKVEMEVDQEDDLKTSKFFEVKH